MVTNAEIDARAIAWGERHADEEREYYARRVRTLSTLATLHSPAPPRGAGGRIARHEAITEAIARSNMEAGAQKRYWGTH